MSCALANPKEGAACANRRPVRGRARQPLQPVQASLVPVAAGHERLEPAAAAPTPFSADAPEATFSLVQLCAPAAPATGRAPVDVDQPVRTMPPSFREIRAGQTSVRAAAATRVPVAEVRIPVSQLDADSLFEAAPAGGTVVLPGMEQLVERVRQRTAARLSRASALTSA